MARLVAEEADYSSGPVEAATAWPSWLYPKLILRASFSLQNSIDLTKLGSFVFVDLSYVLRVVVCFGGCYVSDVVSSFSSSVADIVGLGQRGAYCPRRPLVV